MEIVLGIDNVVFIAILVGRLPAGQQTLGRRLGLILALGIRIGLLLTISWIMGLTEPLFTVFGGTLSGRDLILIGGGLFLIAKATWEIYDKVVAMVLAMLVMLISAAPIGGFVERHPSVKILALAFLLLIGVMLVAEGMGTHVNKGYIYVAMAFSLFV